MNQSELSPQETRIGRLIRKVERLKRQRDLYKKRCSAYQGVIDLHPNIQRTFTHHELLMQERAKVAKTLSLVNSQERLISSLQLLLERTSTIAWRPIAEAPKDREIWVYAPSKEGLDPLIVLVKWHESAGFCIDELREPTLWVEKGLLLSVAI